MFQFLYQVLTLEKYFNQCKLYFYELLEGKIIFKVQHDIQNPFVKTYECMYIPFKLTFDFATFCITNQNNSNDSFYENYVIYNNKFCYYLSKNCMKKITSDFKKIKMISISIDKQEFLKLNACYVDFEITANHLCSIMYQAIGSCVTCYNEELDKITFKDTNIIK